MGSPLKAPGPARSAWQQPSDGGGEGEAGGGRAPGLVLKHQEGPGPGAQWGSYLLPGD